MIKEIIRYFAKWHKIPRDKVPQEVRRKLNKQKYVINENKTREYKKVVAYKEKKGWIQDHDLTWLHETLKSWKEDKYYYRNLR
jgi:hypothetical protein